MRRRGNAALFWPVLLVVLVADVITKAIAERALLPRGIPREVMGDYVRLNLVYNPGAAWGLHVGPHSRWIFGVLTVVALAILARLLLITREGDTPRVVALGLVCAGAVGNLIDRVRSIFGVVDFIDLGINDTTRFPTFNVADIAVSVGATLLAWVLWREDRAAQAVVSPVVVPASASGGEPGDLA